MLKKYRKIILLVTSLTLLSVSLTGCMGGGSDSFNIQKLTENPIIFFIGVIAVVFIMWKMTHKK
jgi:hypothetical protein